MRTTDAQHGICYPVSGSCYLVSGQRYGSLLFTIPNAKTKAADMAPDAAALQRSDGATGRRGICGRNFESDLRLGNGQLSPVAYFRHCPFKFDFIKPFASDSTLKINIRNSVYFVFDSTHKQKHKKKKDKNKQTNENKLKVPCALARFCPTRRYSVPKRFPYHSNCFPTTISTELNYISIPN